ncbi:MAG: hypothetical protein AB7V62_05205 [Thermoleophilia bacterium]
MDSRPDDHHRLLSLTDPPIEEWERQGALRELTRVARDLELEDADAVVARLGRLTQDQRDAVAEAMERILEMGA